MNSEGLIQQLENCLATNDPKYEEFTDVYKLMTIVTIIHEYVHEADRRTKFRLPAGFIDYPTQSMARDYDKHPGKAIHNTAQSMPSEGLLIFYQVTTGSSSGSKKKKPDADAESKKKHDGHN